MRYYTLKSVKVYYTKKSKKVFWEGWFRRPPTHDPAYDLKVKYSHTVELNTDIQNMEPLATVNPAGISCSRFKKWSKSRSISLNNESENSELSGSFALFSLQINSAWDFVSLYLTLLYCVVVGLTSWKHRRDFPAIVMHLGSTIFQQRYRWV